MSGFVSKQPNGKYCRFSTTVDTLTHINMSFEDYVDVIRNMQDKTYNQTYTQAKDIFKNHLQLFSHVIKKFIPTNMSEEEFRNHLVKTLDDNTYFEEIVTTKTDTNNKQR